MFCNDAVIFLHLILKSVRYLGHKHTGPSFDGGNGSALCIGAQQSGNLWNSWNWFIV